MEVLIFLFIMMLYVLLSIVFVKFVHRRTANQTYRRLALAFVFLLPTWDVLLGFIVYYPACLLIPKVAIYETAVTEGIFYEGLQDYLGQMEKKNGDEYKLVATGWIQRGVEKGFRFIEYKSEGKPAIYECTKLNKENPYNEYATAICRVTNSIKSKYEVKATTISVGTAEINFKKIYDRDTGKVMAEFSRVNRWSYAGLFAIPFFNWLDWSWGSKEEGCSRCPSSNLDYELFEYKVLKPNK